MEQHNTEFSPSPHKSHSGSMPTVSPLTPSPQHAMFDHGDASPTASATRKGPIRNPSEMTQDVERRADSRGCSSSTARGASPSVSHPRSRDAQCPTVEMPVRGSGASTAGVTITTSRTQHRRTAEVSEEGGGAHRRGSLFSSNSPSPLSPVCGRQGSEEVRSASRSSRLWLRPSIMREESTSCAQPSPSPSASSSSASSSPTAVPSGVLPTYVYPSPQRRRPSPRVAPTQQTDALSTTRPDRGAATCRRNASQPKHTPLRERIHRKPREEEEGRPPLPRARDTNAARGVRSARRRHAPTTTSATLEKHRHPAGAIVQEGGTPSPARQAPGPSPLRVVFTTPLSQTKGVSTKPSAASPPSSPSSSPDTAGSTIGFISSEGEPTKDVHRHSPFCNDVNSSCSSNACSEACSSLDLCSCCREQVIRLENNYKLMVVRLLREMAAMEKVNDGGGGDRMPLWTKEKESHRASRLRKEDQAPGNRVRVLGISPYPKPTSSARAVGASHSPQASKPVAVLVPPAVPSLPANEKEFVAHTHSAELTTIHLALAALAREVEATKLALRHHQQYVPPASPAWPLPPTTQGSATSFASRSSPSAGAPAPAQALSSPQLHANPREVRSLAGQGATTAGRKPPLRPPPPPPPLSPRTSSPTAHTYDLEDGAQPSSHGRRRVSSSAGSHFATRTGSGSSPDPLPPTLSPLAAFMLAALSPATETTDTAQPWPQSASPTAGPVHEASTGVPSGPAPRHQSSSGGSAGAATTVHTYSHARPSPSPSYPVHSDQAYQHRQPGERGSGTLRSSSSPRGEEASHSRPSGGSRMSGHSVRTQASPSPPSPYGRCVQEQQRHPLPYQGATAAEGRDENKENAAPSEEREKRSSRLLSPPHQRTSVREKTGSGGQGSEKALQDVPLGNDGSSPEKNVHHTRTFSLTRQRDLDPWEATCDLHPTQVALRERAHATAAGDTVHDADPLDVVGLTIKKVAQATTAARNKYLYDLTPEEVAAAKRGRTRRALRKSFGHRSGTASTVPASPLSSSEETALLLSLMYPAQGRSAQDQRHRPPHRTDSATYRTLSPRQAVADDVDSSGDGGWQHTLNQRHPGQHRTHRRPEDGWGEVSTLAPRSPAGLDHSV